MCFNRCMAQSSFKNYQFENLEVWKLAMNILHETYAIIKVFPKTETFGLSGQLRRAAASIALNLAEGSGQPTPKGFAVYIHRSKSSTLECVACLKIAAQENFANPHDIDRLQELLKEEYFKLVALVKSVMK